jgi:hypothetical protein
MKSLIKTGFGLSIGFSLARMVFILIGMAFFIPGYLMFKKADKEDSGSRLGGMVLIVIGVVIMGGLGFGALLDSAGDMFSD